MQNLSPKTFGNFPPVLYRAFKEQKYAIDFRCGKVRFGLLNYYKDTEDTQRDDPTEGTASLHIPGLVTNITLHGGEITNTLERLGHFHYQGSFGNAIYILSCSAPPSDDLSLLRKKFGNFIVRINNPKQLGQDVTDFLWSGSKETAVAVECAKVSYAKGGEAAEELSQDNRLKLSYAQKPEEGFSDDHEYRFVVISKRSASTEEHFLTVDIGKELSYVELLPQS